MVDLEDITELKEVLRQAVALVEKIKRRIDVMVVEDAKLTIQDFTLKLLCEGENVPITLVRTRTRKREVVIIRHMFYALLRENSSLSLDAIGSVFNVDHATVSHGAARIKDLLDTKDSLVVNYEKYNEAVKNYRHSLTPKIRERSEGITE